MASMSIDEALTHIGEYGRFQQLLSIVICFLNIPITFHLVIMYFATFTPDWVCVANSSVCLLNGTLPVDDLARCSMPRTEWRYVYPKDYSIVTQFNADCDRGWLASFTTTVFFIGWAIGALFLGWISDKYGRKLLMTPSLGAVMIFGFFSAFMPNIYLLLVCRFLTGVVMPGTTLQLIIFISEFVGNKHRPFASILVYFTLPVGFSILTLKAYYIRQWKLLTIVCTAPYTLLLGCHFFIPESIRWQMLNGKSDEAMNTLHRMARWNKQQLPDNVCIDAREVVCNKSTPLDMFQQSQKLSLQIVTLAVMWLVSAMGYYGLYLAADDLGGNAYEDFFIMGVTEIPSIVLAIVMCNKMGRKVATLLPLFLGSLACICVAFVAGRKSLKSVKLVIGQLGKFFISTSINAISTWIIEILPTNVRAGAMGFMQVVSRFGSGSAPFVSKGLKVYGQGTPFAVIGASSLIGSVIGMWLPETKAKTESIPAENKSEDREIGISGENEVTIVNDEII